MTVPKDLNKTKSQKRIKTAKINNVNLSITEIQQMNRIDSSKKDIAICEFTNNKPSYDFKIKSMSDKGLVNDYLVTINKTTLTINCDCIDMKYGCIKSNCICKHACYVLLKGLPFYHRKRDNKLFCRKPGNKFDSSFFKTKKFSKEEYTIIINYLLWKYPSKMQCEKINKYLALTKYLLYTIPIGLIFVCGKLSNNIGT
jgi:hypothetical protein